MIEHKLYCLHCLSEDIIQIDYKKPDIWVFQCEKCLGKTRVRIDRV
jgi:hypothetical protein